MTARLRSASSGGMEHDKVSPGLPVFLGARGDYVIDHTSCNNGLLDTKKVGISRRTCAHVSHNHLLSILLAIFGITIMVFCLTLDPSAAHRVPSVPRIALAYLWERLTLWSLTKHSSAGVQVYSLLGKSAINSSWDLSPTSYSADQRNKHLHSYDKRIRTSRQTAITKLEIGYPPSKKEVGNSGWTMIHSVAANFPPQPSESDKYYAQMFLKSISKLYPCKRCRSHFDRYISSYPPDLSSRDALVLWACAAHNDVNRRNGKPEFPCEMPALDQKWGDCGCKSK